MSTFSVLEQEILQRVSRLKPEDQRRVLDFVTWLAGGEVEPLSARELMLLPPAERQRRVQQVIVSSADENFETFEAYSEEPIADDIS